jgi:1-phosphofructokinase family hexose kinase
VILSAGLTPAWQQVAVFDTFRYGEVNRAREVHWFASGKVFNAAIAVHRLGGAGLALAPVGGPPLEQIRQDLGQLGLATRLVVTQSPTRVCTTIIDRGAGKITELVENGQPLTADELAAYRDAYAEEASRAEVAILIGSLPAGAPASYYRDLVERTPCPAVLDFRGEGLLSVLDLKPCVVKPNREELAQTVGRPLETDGQLREAMQSLNRRGAQWVVVTQGGGGPAWITTENAAWRAHPIPVAPQDVVNPIGCGDALTAAIACTLHDGGNVLDGIRLGLAAADANLRQLRQCRFEASGVRELAGTIRIEQIRAT